MIRVPCVRLLLQIIVAVHTHKKDTAQSLAVNIKHYRAVKPVVQACKYTPKYMLRNHVFSYVLHLYNLLLTMGITFITYCTLLVNVPFLCKSHSACTCNNKREHTVIPICLVHVI